MKYAVCIDFKAATGKGLDYKVMKSTSLLDAMAEADAMWNDDVYLMQIMQKVDAKRESGLVTETYSAVLCRRSFGWHLNTTDNGEAEHRAWHFIPRRRDFDWFATC